MQSSEPSKYQFSYDDPRMRMTIGGRLIVRVVSALAYILLAAASLTLLLLGIKTFVALGVFLLLVIGDLLVHYGEGDTPVSELPKSGAVNVAEITTPQTDAILSRAMDRAIIAKHDFLLTLADGLLEIPQVKEGLQRLDVKPEEFRQKVDDLLKDQSPVNEAILEPLMVAAFGEAVAAGHNFIQPGDVFSALAKVNNDAMDRIFNVFSIAPGDLARALIFSSISQARTGGLPHSLSGFIPESRRVIRHRIMNRAWTSRPTPNLDKYGSDLTDLARNAEIGFLVGHDEEYQRLAETLARPINPNALLVGEVGIGKEALINHLAFQLTKDEVPPALFDKRLVSLQLETMVAGAAPEELNARIQTIVNEIYLAGNIILYIPNIHNLVRTSGTAYISAADALMPILMNNGFPVVGTSFPKEFKEYIEARSDFAGAFEIIRVNEMSDGDAEKVLTYQSVILEQQTGLTISFGAIKRSVVLAKKYFRTKFLPASAEELLKSSAIDAERRGEKTLGPDRVTAVAETKVNIPMHEAEGAEAENLLKMEETIHERFVDQEEAVKAVAQALREYRSGLTRKGGPIASFLFVGPTGVGKTELAKILADLQFGSEKMMIRFDMTEYQDKQSFFRFVGSPDGQVRGALTDAVLERPYSLILLDEFEKGFPDILNLFLQVLDDGRLTDNMGRTVDFTNTIIIATSNAHSDIINDALSKGESMSDISEYLKARLTDVFKPELLNRFSKIIIFKNLAPKDLTQIVAFNVKELSDLVKAQGISLDFSPEALALIAKLGYDPQFGARPLRRVIEDKIRAPLAEVLLAKKALKGDRLMCVVKDDGFDFTTAQ